MLQMKNPIYTIIIPHYNIPILLERLLESIPPRNDIQIIVVDDCSTKNIELYEKLKINYDRVEWYSTDENGGGGKARNAGLKYAKGKYIIFADADDFFTSNLNSILDKYKNIDFDIAYFNCNSVYSENLKPANRGGRLQRIFKIYHKNNELGKLYFKYLFGEPWCKIINKEIIKKNQVTFEQTPIHNDTKFSYLIGHYSKNIMVDDTIAYTITYRSKSVSQNFSKENLKIRKKIFLEKNLFLLNNKINLVDTLLFKPYKLEKILYDKDIKYLLKENKLNYAIIYKLFIKLLKNKIKEYL